MKYFDEENRLTTDECALLTKELQNRSVTDYYLYNMYPTSTCENPDAMSEFVANNPNLRYKDGYGFLNQCTVDADTELRNHARMTNFRGREQLCTRWNVAVPDLGKGGLIPNIESRLKMSEDTSDLKDCDILQERDFNRFIPLMGCLSQSIQNPENIILPFERGGQFTRDYVRSDDYLQKCGFVNDGKTWRRNLA